MAHQAYFDGPPMFTFSHGEEAMKTPNFLLISAVAAFLSGCNSSLDTMSTVKYPIPVPQKETIVFLDADYNARITNSDYTKSYKLTVYLADMLDFSPDKQWISYTWMFHIWKMRFDGNDKTQITPSNLEAQGARFSPDGRRFVFGVTRPNSDAYDAWIIDVDGRHPERITFDEMVAPTGEYSFAWPDWSRDGTKIVLKYHRVPVTRLQEHIGIIDLSSRQFTAISAVDSLQPFQPRWSPKRDELLCTVLLSIDYGGTDIYRFDIDGRNAVRLTNSGGSRWPEWSSDGEWFLYEDVVDGMPTIWRMKRDGTGKQQVIIGGHAYGMVPAW